MMVLWLARCYRPDLSTACSALASRVHTWDETCQSQLARTISYVDSTADYGLFMSRNIKDGPGDVWLYAFQDANWAYPKSISGMYAVFISENGTWVPVDWGSWGQPISADSTPAAETISAHGTVKKVLGWSTGNLVSTNSVVTIVGDNKPAERIHLTGHSSKMLAYARALGLRVSLIKDLIQLGILRYAHIESEFNLGDAGTKAQGKIMFQKQRRACGILPIHENFANIWKETIGQRREILSKIVRTRGVSVLNILLRGVGYHPNNIPVFDGNTETVNVGGVANQPPSSDRLGIALKIARSITGIEL